MPSLLRVVKRAPDLSLLSLREMRTVISEADDPTLTRLEAEVRTRITRACKVAWDGVTPPTLRQEQVVETFRLGSGGWGGVGWWGPARGFVHSDDSRVFPELIVQRRPIVTVDSIVEDELPLAADTDYEFDAGAGLIRRLWNDLPAAWRTTKVVVTYTAGWQEVPQDLKTVALRLLRQYRFREVRDLDVRQFSIPGVIERQYAHTVADPDIPAELIDMLTPFINHQVG